MPPLAIAQRDKQQPRKSLDSGERLHYTERGTLHRRAGRAMSFLRRDGHTEMSAITHLVAGLDALLEHLAAQRIAHEPIETYSNGVRHVKVPDPDGNAIAFAEPPGAASA